MAERQDFQKFLKIQVIPGINPKFNLLSLVSLLEHFFLPKYKKKKTQKSITELLLIPVLLSLCQGARALPLANCSQHSQRELDKRVVPREPRK